MTEQMTDPTNDPVPTRVALYALRASDTEPAAVFHWDPTNGVRLELLMPDWTRVARDYYERGVEYFRERRQVLPAEGPTFMRALVQPKRSTYYALVDESRPPADR